MKQRARGFTSSDDASRLWGVTSARPTRDNLIAVGFLVGNVVFGLLAAVFCAAALHDPAGAAVLSGVVAAAGFLLFLSAKVPVLARGVRFSFGSQQMGPYGRAAYRAGYVLMISGSVCSAMLLALLRH